MIKRNFLLLVMVSLLIFALGTPLVFAATPTGVNPAVNMALPNFANSPNLRKFVDSLPGLGAANQNNLGQYIPVANPDTTAYPGSDYYEIGLKQYQQRMHSDLPAPGTKLRGYYQINSGTVGTTDKANQYLGPLIIGKRDRPVRIKFVNQLGINGAGDLPLPVDTTVMGAGMGPLDMPGMPGMKENYTQNRANLHLHGGFNPWISDGTPHQWITPAGDMTQYKKGVSFQNVPDMVGAGKSIPSPAPGDGMGTYYYPNQQSARLMFYHDHSYGITRLNVYAGEAAGYLITDQVEEDLISGTNVSGVFGTDTPFKVLPDQGTPDGVYRYGIPLVIQDKSFVNDASTPPHVSFPTTGTPTPQPTATTQAVDPLWYTHLPLSTGGDLWFPHEYLPNENIYDPNGYWYMGRWDYGPWILPPMLALKNTLPSPSIVPEAFMDTPVVNGTAFPFVELPPTAVRFRILNACNDRMLNLQLYQADPAHPTEVKMVPASPNPAFPTWPRDGRDGGVPDPTTAGPDMIQIGNEAGFLAKVAVIPAQPVDFDYDRTSATFGNVASTALYLPPAVRADVIVDFSAYKDGDTLILYNDAPAPMPLFDDRYDYFTDSKDWTPKGGAPTPQIGFGPNTRTIMQIRIKGTPSAPYDLAALQTVLPKAFAVAQEPPLVPAAAYNAAYGTNYQDTYAGVADYTLNVTGTAQPVARVMTEIPGFGYTTPPTVNFYGGFPAGCVAPTCTPATATATLNGVTGVTLVNSGSGCTSPPSVTFTPAVGGGGTGAAATAIVSGGVVTAVAITNPGSNYLLAPAVSFTGGCTVAPTATAIVALGSVGTIHLTNPGSGYTKAPYVYLSGGGGTGAAAIAMLNGAMVLNGKNLVEGMDMEFGRMNAVLGSIPSPLAPEVGAGPFIGANFYVDPPTEILKAGETSLWRISHLGVDSHAIHFHLFDVQVINRVDWTNTLKPPYDEEIGWKETIRTNPFEDIIVALRPKAMNLPFAIPDSNRLLDPTTPAGSTMAFQPVLPPLGVPAVAQTTNVMTNFGWEYVWHCHLLGHEENDMMRPIVLLPGNPVAQAAPTALAFGNQLLDSTSAAQTVTLSNAGAAGTQSLVINSIGFSGAHAGDFSQTNTCGASLAPGKTCTISVAFTPTATGTRAASLTITSNEIGNSPFTVSLGGTGTAPIPPTVSITAPSNGTSFNAPPAITITAAAAGGTGATVVSVDFYDGTVLLGSTSTSPYSVTWSNVSLGGHSLSATVTDSLGATATSAPVNITVVGAGVPAPWLSQDIGAVGVAGSGSFLNGTFSISGSGYDIWGTADGFRYIYQPLTGDGQIIARVVSLQNTNQWAKGGVMIRQTLTANSPHALMNITPVNGAEFLRRVTIGGTTAATVKPAVAAPYWVKVTRSGNTFRGYVSSDGITWVQVGTSSINMASSAYIGLVVSSVNNGVLCTSTFDGVSVTTGAPAMPPTVNISTPVNGASYNAPAAITIAAVPTPTTGAAVARVEFYAGTTLVGTAASSPYSVTWNNVAAGSYSLTAKVIDSLGAMATSTPVVVTVQNNGLPTPWVTQDVGSVGIAGNASFLGGTYSVSGAGADIWGTADAFRYVYQPLVGDGQIIARVNSLQNTNLWAKGGVMIRETMAANSPNAMMAITPGNGAAFQRRLTTGASSLHTAGPKVAAPYWVKLVRTGSTFSGYVSSDGVTWVLVGSSTINMASSVNVGLAVTSHTTAALSTATMDGVSVTGAVPIP